MLVAIWQKCILTSALVCSLKLNAKIHLRALSVPTRCEEGEKNKNNSPASHTAIVSVAVVSQIRNEPSAVSKASLAENKNRMLPLPCYIQIFSNQASL